MSGLGTNKFRGLLGLALYKQAAAVGYVPIGTPETPTSLPPPTYKPRIGQHAMDRTQIAGRIQDNITNNAFSRWISGSNATSGVGKFFAQDLNPLHHIRNVSNAAMDDNWGQVAGSSAKALLSTATPGLGGMGMRATGASMRGAGWAAGKMNLPGTASTLRTVSQPFGGRLTKQLGTRGVADKFIGTGKMRDATNIGTALAGHTALGTFAGKMSPTTVNTNSPYNGSWNNQQAY